MSIRQGQTIVASIGCVSTGDANAVHTNGNEIINGVKTFNGQLLLSGDAINITDEDVTSVASVQYVLDKLREIEEALAGV